MSKSQIVVGIVSPLASTRVQICTQLQAVRFAGVPVEIDQYCSEPNDRSTRHLIETHPHIIIVDMEQPAPALASLRVLHDALPDAWLLIGSPSDDPKLIIEAMRAGAREFIPFPATSANISQALSRYASELQKAHEKKTAGKIYSVTSAKGGAGTTSVAVNLAVAAAGARDSKVALVDLGSPVGDVAEYLNLRSKFTVADAISSSQRLDPVLLESYMSHTHGVAVLPGYKEYHPGLLNEEALARMFEVLAATYTHTFIDMACSQHEEQLKAATEFSAAVLVILTPELPALWRTDRLIRLFERTGGGDKLILVVNRGSKRREISVREIEKTLGHSIFFSLPNNYPAAIQAVNSGKPLVSMNHSSLAASYFELGQMLTGLPLAKKKRGLFGF